MADMAALRAGLAANLAPVSGVQESAYLLTNPSPPAAEIEPAKIRYDEAFRRGLDILTFVVRVFVTFSSDLGAQMKLDAFMASSGPMSIKAAIESNPTLGGAADDLRVTECSGYKIFTREITTAAGRGSAGGPMIGAEWTVEVYVEGA